MDNLTNDAKYLLSNMYACYLKRRKNGDNKAEAIKFNNIDNIRNTIMPEWSFEDVEFTCFELRNHKYLDGIAADNTIFHITLTTTAIAALETTFKDKVDLVLNYAAKIKNAIPFV